LLYGAYKLVKINWSGEDHANIVRIEPDIRQGQPLLNLYGVELRFEGNQEIIDQMIKLIDYQKIRNAILRY
jgi:hypothetical protein